MPTSCWIVFTPCGDLRVTFSLDGPGATPVKHGRFTVACAPGSMPPRCGSDWCFRANPSEDDSDMATLGSMTSGVSLLYDSTGQILRPESWVPSLVGVTTF